MGGVSGLFRGSGLWGRELGIWGREETPTRRAGSQQTEGRCRQLLLLPLSLQALHRALLLVSSPTLLFCVMFKVSQVLGWRGWRAVGWISDQHRQMQVQGSHGLTSHAITIVTEKAPRTWPFPEVLAVRPTNKNKWASFGATLFYLLKQMYSASFSAFPQFSPSVCRPILFTGKQQQQNIFLYMVIKVLFLCHFLNVQIQRHMLYK